MPIEFYCPGCGNLMRTPDETAGRKGRCPTCQLKVQIPANSVAATSSESAVPRSAIAASPKGNGPEPICFDCGSCGKTLSIAAANAGKRGKCPHCGELMSIPLKSPAPGERWKGTPKQRPNPAPASSSTPNSKPASAPASKPAATPAPKPAATPAPTSTATRQPAPVAASSEKIEFHCSSCREVVRVGVAAAGKKGKCPRCQAVIEIPLKSTSVSGLQPIPNEKPTAPRPQGNPTKASPGLTPLPSEPRAPGNPAKAVPGLTPLPAAPGSLNAPTLAGLTPLPSNTPASAGLTPIDDSGLSPLEPLGLTPLGPVDSGALGGDLFGIDPFGATQVGVGNPFGADLNPYSASAPVPVLPGRPRKAKGERTGAEIATMICGACLVFYAAAQIVIVVLSLLFQGAAAFAMLERFRAPGQDQAAAAGYFAGQIIAIVLTSIVMLTILAGGIQMIRLKAWGLCLAACILTMLPCNCPFCVFGIPIGIWGTVMLSLGTVRSAFR